MIHFSVRRTQNSGLDNYIQDMEEEMLDILTEVMHEGYDDVRRIMENHLESLERRPYDREPGDLKEAINESEASMPRAVKNRHTLSIRIGNINILNEQAPHWAYLEYGTRQMSDEWPLYPYNPVDSPDLYRTDHVDKNYMDEYRDKDDKLPKGVSPNRAWRMALWNSKAKIKSKLDDRFGTQHRMRKTARRMHE